jgi:hypothetical protein
MPAVQELAQLIDTAAHNRWCMRWGCTTCGSREFRTAVLSLIENHGAIAVAHALNSVSADKDDALHFLVRQITQKLSERQLAIILINSPAALMFERLRQTRNEALARRREYAQYNSPEAIAERRAAKKRAKAEAHAARIAAKKERDAIYWQQRGGKSAR